VLAAGEPGELAGFIYAGIRGPVFSVDAFVVAKPDLWPTTGRMLLDSMAAEAGKAGAAEVHVVCGPKDVPKRQMLVDAGYEVGSEWFVKPIPNF